MSTEGGSSVYVRNTREVGKNVTLENLNFDGCKAQYGGAVYIYSESSSTTVSIKSCVFTKNSASEEEKENQLFGGCAIYLTALIAKVLRCRFSGNIGTSVKLINEFEKTLDGGSFILLSNSYFVLIAECEFTDTDDLSTSSLYYLRGKNAVSAELSDCSFTEKLMPGAHIIDGASTSESGHKLTVKNCEFDDTKENSIGYLGKSSLNANNKISSYISIDFKDQVFKTVEKEVKKENSPYLLSTKMIALIASCAVAIIVGLVVLVLKKKKFNIQEEDHSNESDL